MSHNLHSSSEADNRRDIPDETQGKHQIQTIIPKQKTWNITWVTFTVLTLSSIAYSWQIHSHHSNDLTRRPFQLRQQ